MKADGRGWKLLLASCASQFVGYLAVQQLSGFLVLSSPFGRENQGWRGRLVSSYGRHCVSEPENPSLTETWREVFTERLSRS